MSPPAILPARRGAAWPETAGAAAAVFLESAPPLLESGGQGRGGAVSGCSRSSTASSSTPRAAGAKTNFSFLSTYSTRIHQPYVKPGWYPIICRRSACVGGCEEIAVCYQMYEIVDIFFCDNSYGVVG